MSGKYTDVSNGTQDRLHFRFTGPAESYTGRFLFGSTNLGGAVQSTKVNLELEILDFDIAETKEKCYNDFVRNNSSVKRELGGRI